jgi:hypothetical protein
MNVFRKSNHYTGSFREIANIPLSEMSAFFTATIDSSVNKVVSARSYDPVEKKLVITTLVYFNTPDDDTQLKYSAVTFKQNGRDIGKVILSDEQEISNCIVYELICYIFEKNSLVEVKIRIKGKEEKLSTEISDDNLEYRNDRFDTVFSERLSRKIGKESNRYNSTYNNMFELNKYNDGVIISGERVLDHNFISYKYIPYAYKIIVPNDSVKLYYCQWEGCFYAHKKIGDHVYYRKLPNNVRTITVNDLTTNDSKFYVGDGGYEFIKEGVIINDGKTVVFSNHRYDASGNYKFIPTNYKPYTTITSNLTRNPIKALQVDEEKNLFMGYGTISLAIGYSLYAIENGVLKMKTDSSYCFVVKSKGTRAFYSNNDEIFLSPTKSYNPSDGKFYLYKDGRKTEINIRDLRFVYNEPIPSDLNIRVLGRALYDFKNNEYTLI